VNVFAAVGRLADMTPATVRLNRDRCLYASDRFATCNACQDLCPANAIRAGQPPELDEAACAGCLACFPACPVGAFSGEDAVAVLLENAAHVHTRSFELICEKHPRPGEGLDASAVGLRVRGCLAGLGVGAYLALVAQGAERVVARAEACAGCPWGALQPRIEAQAQQAQQLLEAWGRGVAVSARVQLVERGVARGVQDTQDLPISRRDLFRQLTRQVQVAATRVWKEDEPEVAARTPGRDRRRIAQAAAFFSTDTASRPPAAVLPMGAGWTALTASAACTACGACARACPTGALRLEQDAANHFALRFAPLDCVGCEVCQHVCAPAALTADHAPTFEQVFGGAPQTLCAGELARCERCGALMAAHPGQTLCAVCAQRRLNPFGQHFPPGWRGAPRRPEQPR
jgi:ferredoxin